MKTLTVFFLFCLSVGKECGFGSNKNTEQNDHKLILIKQYFKFTYQNLLLFQIHSASNEKDNQFIKKLT